MSGDVRKTLLTSSMLGIGVAEQDNWDRAEGVVAV
jgi:hypothetical protein